MKANKVLFASAVKTNSWGAKYQDCLVLCAITGQVFETIVFVETAKKAETISFTSLLNK